MSSEGNVQNLFDGYVNEVIYYDHALTLAERQVIHNYLSSKWNTKLDVSTEYYAGDTAALGDYDYDVSGILKLADSEVDSNGEHGAVVISNAAENGFLKDTGDAVFIGQKGTRKAVDDDLAADATVKSRSDIVWFLDATDIDDNRGNIDLSFYLKEIGLGRTTYASDYVLLWRSNQTDEFTELGAEGELDGDQLSFTNLAIHNEHPDGYFTIGSKNDLIAPDISGAESGSNSATLLFDEVLDVTATVGQAAFTIQVNGVSRAVTDVAIAGNKVEVAFDGATQVDTDTIAVSYTKPADGPGISDALGNDDVSPLNILIGGTGSDELAGSSAADFLIGNSGDDKLTGGAGADTFAYTAVTDGNDTLTDFSLDEGDSLDFSALLDCYDAVDNPLANFLTVSNSDVNDDVTIAVDANGDGSEADFTITLQGIGADALLTLESFANNIDVPVI